MSETIRISIDRDIIDLAENFLANRRSQKQEWRKAVADGNIDALRRLGHELKGTAASFGFQGLSNLAKEMEKAVTGGDLARAEDTVERMIGFLDNATILPR